MPAVIGRRPCDSFPDAKRFETYPASLNLFGRVVAWDSWLGPVRIFMKTTAFIRWISRGETMLFLKRLTLFVIYRRLWSKWGHASRERGEGERVRAHASSRTVLVLTLLIVHCFTVLRRRSRCFFLSFTDLRRQQANAGCNATINKSTLITTANNTAKTIPMNSLFWGLVRNPLWPSEGGPIVFVALWEHHFLTSFASVPWFSSSGACQRTSWKCVNEHKCDIQ